LIIWRFFLTLRSDQREDRIDVEMWFNGGCQRVERCVEVA
jgi:hypothetical protein